MYGKVDYIIIDSPILFGMVYKNKYGTSYPQGIYGDSFDKFLLDLFNQYENINILLKRKELDYQDMGRFQDLKESKEIDQSLKNILETNNVNYMEFEVSDDLTKKLYNKLFN